MSPITIAAIIAIASVIVSWIGSAFIAGYRWGTVKTRVEILERSLELMATKDQLQGIKESLAEIKGAFFLLPRDLTRGTHD